MLYHDEPHRRDLLSNMVPGPRHWHSRNGKNSGPTHMRLSHRRDEWQILSGRTHNRYETRTPSILMYPAAGPSLKRNFINIPEEHTAEFYPVQDLEVNGDAVKVAAVKIGP